MARKSAASLITVIGPGGVETIRRPQPPLDLTGEQQQIWTTIVNRMAADWFPAETHGLLTQYCRLTIRARRIAEMIEAMEKLKGEDFDLQDYRRLIRDEAAVSQAIAILARNMRLSQGSTSRQEYVKKRPMTMRKPWDRKVADDDEED